MSYWSLLEQARERLTAGEFLEAERLYDQARKKHESSKLRAPLMEKGVEPLVRWGRRIVGKSDQAPAAPAFATRVAQLQKDLTDVSALHLEDARRRALAAPEAGDREGVTRLGAFLQLHEESRLFQLDDKLHWPVLRAYLAGCALHEIPVSPGLLSSGLRLHRDAVEWLCRWIEARVDSEHSAIAALAPWFIRQLSGPALDADDPLRGQALAIVARLHLFAPDGAPRALQVGREALHAAAPPDDPAALLRLVGSLACNEVRLAAPAVDLSTLQELESLARRHLVPWPPRELDELLAARRGRGPHLAAITWEGGPGERVLLLRFDGAAAIDALPLIPVEELGENVDPFVCTMTEAVARIEEWLEDATPVLCPEEPPAWLIALLGDRAFVPLRPLESALEPLTAVETPPSGGPHPLLNGAEDPLAVSWAPLGEHARSLSARLAALGAAPAFGGAWGLRNLEALGRAGLALPRRLAVALRALRGPQRDQVQVQRWEGSVPLEWPRLATRSWPRARQPLLPVESSTEDSLLLGQPSAVELASWTLASAPALLLCRDAEEGDRVARTIAAHLDATQVTLAPATTRCPESCFALLDAWIEESLVEESRALDVLWLYNALASTPEGDLDRWLRHGGREPARAEALGRWRAAPPRCTDACRLQAHGQCFDAQRHERRAAGSIWIEWAERIEELEADRLEGLALVTDDLVRLVSAAEDDVAMARWAAIRDGARRARSLMLWCDAVPYGEALARELVAELDSTRRLRVLTDDGARPLSLHLSPPGYAAGSLLLGDEARAVARARASAWRRKSETATLWAPPSRGEDPWFDVAGMRRVQGCNTRPGSDLVVVPLLARGGELPRILALLRLAMATTHAGNALVCLDPRLSDLFGDASHLAPSVRQLEDPSAAVQGAAVLDRLPARQAGRWRTPLDRKRLETVATAIPELTVSDRRLTALARALAEFKRGDRLALGGCAEEDRSLLAAVLARLAAESRDGGPLGARCVLWLSSELPPALRWNGIEARQLGGGGEGLEQAILAAEAGELHLIGMSPALFEHETVQSWIGRFPSCISLLPDGDRAWPRHPAHEATRLRVLECLRANRAEQRPGVIVLLDDADPSVGGALQECARALGAPAGLVESDGEGESGWRWQRIRLEDPPFRCRDCGSPGLLFHPHVLCARCGRALLDGGRDRMLVEELLAAARVRWLSRQGLDEHWLVVTADRRQRDSLRRGLGIVGDESAAPLLGEDGTVYPVRILSLAQLWEESPPDGELLFTGIPEDPTGLRAALARFAAVGRAQGVVHFFDHPLCWELEASKLATPAQGVGDELRAGALRWDSTRAEVEFRAREGLARVARALRARRSGGGSLRHGLGPFADPLDDPRLASLGRAMVSSTPEWREAAEGARGAAGRSAEDLEEPGLLRVRSFLDRLIAAGLAFDAPAPLSLDLDTVFSEVEERAGAEQLLGWFRDEGMLSARAGDGDADQECVESVALDAEHRARWLESARATPVGIAVTPPTMPPHPTDGIPAAQPLVALTDAPRWTLGVPGSGKSTALMGITHALPREGGRVPLVVVAGASGLLRWESLRRDRGLRAQDLQVAHLREIIFSFMACHYELGGFSRPPRLLHDLPTSEGEELRTRLLRETSRRYAVAAGGTPPVDLVQMRKILEGGEAAMSMAAGEDAALDVGLLRDCAAAARRAGGWILPGEVGQLARRWLVEHPYVGETWRDRYEQVIVDDLDAMPEEELRFLDRLFPEGFRISAADPALLPSGHALRGDSGERKSLRLPREIARAADGVLREELLGRGTIKPRGREKGRLDRRQVLNLEACVLRVEEALRGRQWQQQRVGIVVTYGGDLPRLASRLREMDIPVWPAAQVLSACAPGPRELLMTLILAVRADELDRLLVGSLAVELLHSSGIAVPSGGGEKLGERLLELMGKGEGRPRHPAESFLLPLVSLSPRFDEVESLAEVALMLERTHLLRRVRRDDAAASRLAAYLRERGDAPWRAVLRGIDPEGLVDPLAPGPRVWLLGPSDLAGIELDRAFYLCTGHEPAELHYRVLGRVRENLTVLYSETDPFDAPR